MTKEELFSQDLEEGNTPSGDSLYKIILLSARKRINAQLVNRALLAVVVVMGVYYFTGVNDLAVKGFTMQELSRELNSLTEENKDLTNTSLALKSFDNVNDRIKNLGMVAVGSNVDYVSAGASLVAKR